MRGKEKTTRARPPVQLNWHLSGLLAEVLFALGMVAIGVVVVWLVGLGAGGR